MRNFIAGFILATFLGVTFAASNSRLGDLVAGFQPLRDEIHSPSGNLFIDPNEDSIKVQYFTFVPYVNTSLAEIRDILPNNTMFLHYVTNELGEVTEANFGLKTDYGELLYAPLELLL